MAPASPVLPAGTVLVAGPEALPLAPLVAAWRRAGRSVLVVGARVDDTDDRVPPPAQESGVLAWLDTHAGPRTVLLVDGAESLGDWRAGERSERRLARFLEGMPRGPDIDVVACALYTPERLQAPDADARFLLGHLDALRFWDGAALHAPRQSPAGLGAWLRDRDRPWLLAPDGARLEQALGLVLAGVAYAVCAVGLLLPSLVGDHAGTPLVGDAARELPGSLWLNAWVARTLAAGESLLQTDQLLWPLGGSPIQLFGNLGASAFALPFQALLGYPGYWNWWIGATLVANGLAARALARDRGAGLDGAWLAGLVFCAAPPLLDEVSTGNQAVLFAAPFVLALRSGLRALDGRRADGWLFGAWTAIACLVWWFWGAFAFAPVAIAAAHRAVSAPGTRALLMPQAGRALQGWLPCLPASLPLVALANRDDMQALSWLKLPGYMPETIQETMAAHVTASHSVQIERLLAMPDGTAAWIPGLLVLALLYGWVLLPIGRHRLWPFVVIGAGTLAAGPYLPPRLGLSTEWLPLPLAWIQYFVPFTSTFHHPQRALVLAVLGVAVMLALAWSHLRGRLHVWVRGAAWVAIVAAVLAAPRLVGSWPVTSFDYAAPSWLALLGDRGAVVDLPLGFSEGALMAWPEHGRPVATGPGAVTSLADGFYREALVRDASLSLLLHDGPPPDGASTSRLASFGAGHVIVHSRMLRAVMNQVGQNGSWALPGLLPRVDNILGPPIFTNDDVIVYRVAR